MADDKKAVDLGLLEEDDEFEEFPTAEWDGKEEDQSDVNVWEDNWDDDTVEDDFSTQLSKLNRKRSMAPSPMASTNGHGSSLEPSAKKVCARNTSCAADESRLKNGNSTNGHSKASDNDVEDVTMAEDVSDAKVVETSPVTSRRGRPPRVTRQSSSKTDEDSSSEGRTPTRASARLRKSKK